MPDDMHVEVPQDVVDQWQQIVELMADFLDVPSAIITKVHPPQISVLRGNTGEGNPYKAGVTVPLAGLFCEEVIRARAPIQIDDARKDDRWKDAPEIHDGIVSYLGYHICWPDGKVFGTICVMDSKENHYGARYHALLSQFRELIEAHLATVFASEQLRRKNEALTSMLQELSVLRGILPICAKCKRIRNDKGYWQQVEEYISQHSEALFSHGLCPECESSYVEESKAFARRHTRMQGGRAGD
jgi:transcriptional regulator with GAF, ATPase, and Fis domain